MKKVFQSPIFAMLALAVAASYPVCAQQSHPSLDYPPRHLAPSAVSPADMAAVEAHRSALAESAAIYGYDLEAGDWSWEQVLCVPMPDTILLHYSRQFPDGTESLFTALIPREAGRVHVVPVLYRNATPFVPAPKNPASFALFNQLVPLSIARQAMTGNQILVLSACYAEMTGGIAGMRSVAAKDAASIGLPVPMIHLDPKNHLARVMLPTLEQSRTYRAWTITFNSNGRVIAADTEEHTLYASQGAPQPQPATAATALPATEPAYPPASEPAIAPPPPSAPSAPATISAPATASAPVNAATSSSPAPASGSESQPGLHWKVIPPAPAPVWKSIPPAPQPPVKVVPSAPDPLKPATDNQPQQ